MTVLASIAVFSADDTMPEITENTVSGSGVSSGDIGCGGGGTSHGSSTGTASKLPDVSFTANYESDNSRFEVITEINSDGCAQNTEVMVAAYKNNALQKLLFSIKLNSDSVYDKKITRYSIVQESDNPTDFSFKCFTLGENLRPVLPVYTVTGRQAMENSGEYSVKLRGIVTANSATDINSQSVADNGAEAPFVKVHLNEILTRDFTDFEISSEQTFSADKTDAESYLGMAVTMEVAKNEDGTYKVISICEDTDVNKVVSFSPECFEEVISYPDSAVSGELKYYSDTNAKEATTAKLSPSLSVVYNYTGGQELSKILSGSNKSGIVACNGRCDFSGEITLIDNDGTGVYDVVFVKLASTAVTAKTSSDGTVLLKQAVSLPDGSDLSGLYTEAPKQRTDIMRNGKKISSADLSEWDVLSVYAASDKAGYIYAEVITTELYGMITGSFKSETSATGVGFIIKGLEYDIAGGAYGCSFLEDDDQGTFYIDKYGRIAAYREPIIPGTYAYVFKSAVDDSGLNGPDVLLRLVTGNGAETVSLANVVSLYAPPAHSEILLRPQNMRTTGNSAEDLRNFFGTDINNCVIKYTQNEAGQITSITLADYKETFESTKSNITGRFDAGYSRIGSMWIDADSIIFFTDPYDYDKCTVGTVSDLEDAVDYTVLKAYADSRAEDNNIIVIEGGRDVIGPKRNVSVITKIMNTRDENGDDTYSVSYLLDGQLISSDTVPLADMPAGIDALSVGDVVKLKTNSDGKICNIQFVWDFDEGVRSDAEKLTEGGVCWNGDEIFDGGAVYAYKAATEEITFGSGRSYYLSKADNVYVIDPYGRKLSIVSGDLLSYKYYEALYAKDADGNNCNVEISVDGVEQRIVQSNDIESFAGYTDYVYVRQYDGKVIDVVIVKGAREIKTRILL